MVDNSVEAMINNIVSVVLRVHFYYITDPELKMDLRQEGYLKAYELLASGNYDPYRNLRTFIYTGIRNAMTNYMYHYKKENHDSLEVTLESPTWMSAYARANNGNQRGELFYYDEDIVYNYDIDEEIINKICKKYSMFGDYLTNTQKKLDKMGIYTGEIKDEEVEQIELVQDAILGEILWQTLKKN